MKVIEIPKVGDKIYVPTSLHVYNGKDDTCGGLATISEVKISDHLPIEHMNSIFIKVKELSQSHSYNYKSLLQEQDRLKLQFGDNQCYPDPDDREEFNNDNSDWK